MRGLILKDLYVLKSMGKQYAMVMGFMLLWAVAMKTPSFVYFFSIMMGAMILLSSLTLDEAVSFNRFALTMPVNVNTLIKEKYVLFLITMGMGVGASFILMFIIQLLPVSMEEFDYLDMLPVMTIFIVGTAIALPFVFQKGAEKGRYAYIASMLGMGVVFYGIIKLCTAFSISLEEIAAMKEGVFAVLLSGGSVISLLVSYQVSVKIVRKKEW